MKRFNANAQKWILVWIATPLTRLAMTEKRQRKKQIYQTRRRKDFAMILGAFKAVARAHTWSYVTADTAAESTKSAQNKRSGASLRSRFYIGVRK